MFTVLEPTPEVYQGHFGEFTISKADRLGVVIYRGATFVAALCLSLGAMAILLWGPQPFVLRALSGLFVCFGIALGVSLATIHIYMASLHRALQLFWLVGSLATVWIAVTQDQPLAIAIYNHPLNLLGVGWLFVALTGVYFKEAFCFNHGETKILTAVVPLLLLGHWLSWLPLEIEQGLLTVWASLFLIYAIRKLMKPIPPDIGDKSVFAYLHRAQQQPQS